MKFLEDLNISEIAQILDTSESNIRVIQHRALNKLIELRKKWKKKMNSLNYEKLEEILRQLKNQPLENGTLLGLPEEDREIAVLAAELQSIPLLNAPHAKIRRKYALASEPIPLWKNLVFSFRYSIGIAILLCVMFTSGIAYSTAGSLPGEKTFGLKKSAEQFRVKFALNGAQRAYLQLQIAKKRLNEAQQIVQNQNSEAAFWLFLKYPKPQKLPQMKSKPFRPKSIKESSRPLLSSLEDVGKQEKDLVFQLSQNGSAQEGKEDVIALSLKTRQGFLKSNGLWRFPRLKKLLPACRARTMPEPFRAKSPK